MINIIVACIMVLGGVALVVIGMVWQLKTQNGDPMSTLTAIHTLQNLTEKKKGDEVVENVGEEENDDNDELDEIRPTLPTHSEVLEKLLRVREILDQNLNLIDQPSNDDLCKKAVDQLVDQYGAIESHYVSESLHKSGLRLKGLVYIHPMVFGLYKNRCDFIDFRYGLVSKQLENLGVRYNTDRSDVLKALNGDTEINWVTQGKWGELHLETVDDFISTFLERYENRLNTLKSEREDQFQEVRQKLDKHLQSSNRIECSECLERFKVDTTELDSDKGFMFTCDQCGTDHVYVDNKLYPLMENVSASFINQGETLFQFDQEEDVKQSVQLVNEEV